MKAQYLGHVVFYVRDLKQSLQFYRDLLGFEEIGHIFNGAAAALTSGRTHHELLLIQVGDAPGPPPGRRRGLYHIGIKIGDSLDELRAAKKELEAAGITIDGMSDHTVSQSLYLQDPDGMKWKSTLMRTRRFGRTIPKPSCLRSSRCACEWESMRALRMARGPQEAPLGKPKGGTVTKEGMTLRLDDDSLYTHRKRRRTWGQVVCDLFTELGCHNMNRPLVWRAGCCSPSFFVWAGLHKIFNPAGTQQYMLAYGLTFGTMLLYLGATLIEIAGGVSLALGYLTREAAFKLVAFMVVVTGIFPTHLTDPNQVIHLLKNIVITGGLLYVGAYGPGAISREVQAGLPNDDDAMRPIGRGWRSRGGCFSRTSFSFQVSTSCSIHRELNSTWRRWESSRPRTSSLPPSW